MKQRYLLGLLLAAGLGEAGCQDDVYVLDTLSTMRYDVLKLPTAADTMKLTAVDFVSAREGFVGGAGGALFATTDGGLTWARRPLLGTATINKLTFSSATAGWAATNNGLYRTANGGQTWQVASTYDPYNGYMSTVTDIQWVTAQVGYVVGDGAGIYKTTNGGTSWTSLQSRRDKRYLFRAVAFSSPDSGTVAGDNSSYWRTTNGGRTWDIYDYYTNDPEQETTYDLLRFNLKTYQEARPNGFHAYDAYDNYSADEGYGYPVYGLAAATPRGPIVAVGKRTIVRRHEEFSKKTHTPWANVHRPDGTSFEDTYYAADFADASTFYAVGARGIIHRFHYQ